MENRILGKSIAMLYRREQKYMIHKIKELGIGYSEYNFLFYLSVHPGSSQKDMCQHMAVDEALAVRVMKKLEEKGFIIRKKSEKNARLYEISLTEKGMKLIPQLKGYLCEWWGHVTSVLSKEEKSEVLSGIEKMAIQSEYVLKEMEQKGV